jgi:tRNA/tmRNA/rRNA uracil-C5-methylase (TrmA/RlmC/RlmD family)
VNDAAREDWTGRVLDLAVGPPGHGGFCVARVGDPASGRVVFVRHTLPGERVRAVVTEDPGRSFCRADAVEVLHASPDRVTPPCPHAGPGRCGGCDLQHASGAAQRAFKAAVVRDQFRRLAGVEVDLGAAEELPGGLLGWRSRITFAVAADGTVGLHRHRSHHIEPVTECPLAVPEVAHARQAPAGSTAIEAVRGDDGAVAVLAHSPGPGRQARGRRAPDRVRLLDGPARLVHRLADRQFEVDAAGFWQVHPHALQTFVAALLTAVSPRPGETVLDLYAGAGALTAALADAVGPTGRVIGLESSERAVADAEGNLSDLPWAEVRRARVDREVVARLDDRVDVVVLDPPRAGAGTPVMQALIGLAPRCVGYVSCDPATLARDVRVALDAGWRLAELRAFDAFPMTHHVECLAVLVPQALPAPGPAADDTGAITDGDTPHPVV